jgi:hypothetical protein
MRDGELIETRGWRRGLKRGLRALGEGRACCRGRGGIFNPLENSGSSRQALAALDSASRRVPEAQNNGDAEDN